MYVVFIPGLALIKLSYAVLPFYVGKCIIAIDNVCTKL
jgi:hypothetical protein